MTNRRAAKNSFRLYVTGHSNHAQTDTENLRKICESIYQGDCEIEIIDVLLSPEKAEIDHILATPTLIKIAPPPERRVIGDLSDAKKVFAALGLAPDENH